jgi:hypothetical protein
MSASVRLRPSRTKQSLKDAIRALVEAYADTFGVRIKRRQMTTPQIAALYATYAARADSTTRGRRKPTVRIEE